MTATDGDVLVKRESPAGEDRSGWRRLVPGVLATGCVLAVYVGLALSVNFSHATFGFKSDEATYYMMAHSLAEDGDLTYRREDLVRVWHEFSAGPTGLFLKKGRALDVAVDSQVPFVHVTARPDPDTGRLFYGKSFAYPLFAAPWVWAFGTGGFLLFHSLLLSLFGFAAFLFLAVRSRPVVAALLAVGFVVASVAPAYLVWTTPEVFNLTLVFLGYFCWLYKEVAWPGPVPRGLGWLLGYRSDLAATVLLAVASFSKPSNALLAIPMGLLWLWRRQIGRAITCSTIFVLIIAAFFAANLAATGELNFQGGERRTYVNAFPFLPGGADFNVGLDRTTNTVPVEIIFGPNFWTVFRHNLVYFFLGRYSGLVPYFFPAVFALAAFLIAWRRRQFWQYLVLGAITVEILLLLIWIPYNYFGGGGVVGNRYFMNIYGLFVFLLPPIESVTAALAPWMVGLLFTSQITFNPFYSSFRPSEHAMQGPLRLLPVEKSLVNDLPVNVSGWPKQYFTQPVPFVMFFLDANVYPPQNGAFWVRGEATSESLFRGPEGTRRLVLTLTGGDLENTVTVRVDSRSQVVHMTPGQVSTISVALSEGFPYPGGRVWKLTITSRTGFVPMFSQGGVDSRFLGVQVKPELMP